MIDEGLIETKTKFSSDDWYRSVGSGEFASVISAAWAPGMFLNNASEGAGKWRIAQMPTWNVGEKVSSEYGGSSLALMSSSKNADAAYKFMEFASTNSDAIMSRVDQGGFPADLKTMSNDKFLSQTTMVNSDGTRWIILVVRSSMLNSPRLRSVSHLSSIFCPMTFMRKAFSPTLSGLLTRDRPQ